LHRLTDLDRLTKHPTNQTNIQPTNQTSIQSTNQPNSQPTNQTSNQSTNQTTKPPTNQLTNETASYLSYAMQYIPSSHPVIPKFWTDNPHFMDLYDTECHMNLIMSE
jgi:hypothetical protein